MSSSEIAATRAAAQKFLSVPQVARLLGTSKMTIYRAIAAGEFPAVRIRGRLIIPARALDAMVEAVVAEQTVIDSSFWVPEPQHAKEA